MPYGMGWTGAQYSTPPSGNSPGSFFAYGNNGGGAGGNTVMQTPVAAGGAPTTGVFGMDSTMSQCLIFLALIVFLAAWHAHAFSLME